MESNQTISLDDLSGYTTSTVLAKLFGVTSSRIHQLTKDGVIHTTMTRHGNRYEMIPTIHDYIDHLSKKAHGKEEKSHKITELTEQKLRAEVGLKESQEEMHKLKTEIACGKYIDIQEVSMDYAKFFTVFKRFALSIASRVAGRLSGRLDPVEVRDIENEIGLEVMTLLDSFVVAGMTKEEHDKNKSRSKTSKKT